jgi:hypothetical protein
MFLAAFVTIFLSLFVGVFAFGEIIAGPAVWVLQALTLILLVAAIAFVSAKRKPPMCKVR